MIQNVSLCDKFVARCSSFLFIAAVDFNGTYGLNHVYPNHPGIQLGLSMRLSAIKMLLDAADKYANQQRHSIRRNLTTDSVYFLLKISHNFFIIFI